MAGQPHRGRVVIRLAPDNVRHAKLPSGRVALSAEDGPWRVLAVASRLPSGRWLVEHVALWCHGRPVPRSTHPLDTWAREQFRSELLDVLAWTEGA